MNDRRYFWNSAAMAGIVLGCVSILYMVITYFTGKIQGASMLVSVLNLVLWAGKLVGCIVLLRMFMLRYLDGSPDVSRKNVFRFGMATAFLSALIFAAYVLAHYMFIDTESFQLAIDLLEQNPMMDSNSIQMLEQMAPKMPTYAFFGNLIYCYIYGTVASAILSRYIVPDNPFA